MTVEKRIRDKQPKAVDDLPTFRTLASVYGGFDGTKREARGAVGQLRIREAYIAIFEGRGNREDADIVYVDLAKFSGYLNTTPPETPASELKFYEGQRSIFGRIASFIDPSLIGMRALQRAVADETAVDRNLQTEIT